SSRRRHTRSKRDWSSDVCSSDLVSCDGGHNDVCYIPPGQVNGFVFFDGKHGLFPLPCRVSFDLRKNPLWDSSLLFPLALFCPFEIGRASCRERVWMSVVAGEMQG